MEIEDQILAVLSENQGSILDDGEGVSVLQKAKQLSDEIAIKQQDAAKTEQAIDKVGMFVTLCSELMILCVLLIILAPCCCLS